MYSKSAKRFSVFVLLMIQAVLAALLLTDVDAGNSASAETEMKSIRLEKQIENFSKERRKLRAEQKAQLNDIAHSPDTDEEIIAMARVQLLDLCRREEQEMLLESLFEMRGWNCTVVMMSNDSVNVLIQSEGISSNDASIITEHVCRETGIMSANVKIIPIN